MEKLEWWASSKKYEVGEIIQQIRGGKQQSFKVAKRVPGLTFGSWKYEYMIEPVKPRALLARIEGK